MKSREKPSGTEASTPTEPIKVIKSDLMKNMLAAMNKHFEESSSQSNDEPIIIQSGGGPGVPPPPPPPPFPSGGSIIVQNIKKEEKESSSPEPPKIGVPPPPPPPPMPVFDPNKAPKKQNKPAVKKQEKKIESKPAEHRPSLKEQLMRVWLKKIGKK